MTPLEGLKSMALVASGYRLPHATNTQERASERNSQVESVLTRELLCPYKDTPISTQFRL